MVLSSVLPPLSTKVVGNQFSPVRANERSHSGHMSLCMQLKALPGPHNIYAGLVKPQLWEIQSPLTWVSGVHT